jgi:acyl dehydratase
MSGVENSHLIEVGERLSRTVRYSRDEIAAFARMTFDENPLHVDNLVAQRARFGEIIASGQQTSAVMMGMLATYFSRADDGVARQMLCLNMNFSFKSPVFADQDVLLTWQVASIEWRAKLGGQLAQLDGNARIGGGKPLIIARGTILVSESTLKAAP